MKRIAILSFVFLISLIGYAQKKTPLITTVQSRLQSDAFKASALVQAGFHYSLSDKTFYKGRSFEAKRATVTISGKLDKHFFYVARADMIKEPNLLDAYIGYARNEKFKVRLGVLKPKQNLDNNPSPVTMDFISRTMVNDLLIDLRQVGLAMEGKIGGFGYAASLVNGNHTSLNSDGNFYAIGRLQYEFFKIVGGNLVLGISGSHGECPDVQSGLFGPQVTGNRKTYGADLYYHSKKLMFKAEYLEGDLEIEQITPTRNNDIISGYYFTLGYNLSPKLRVLSRWQNWQRKALDTSANQLTVAVNQMISKYVSYRFNFNLYKDAIFKKEPESRSVFA